MAPLTVATTINAPIDTVWRLWTEPAHITQWCHASDDWEAPHAENDLIVGAQFTTTMAAKDGSTKFDFSGTYTQIVPHQRIAYTMADSRKVSIEFVTSESGVTVTEMFDPEHENSLDLQRSGWQAILDNFKKHVEAHA